jgi:hypothetical protein
MKRGGKRHYRELGKLGAGIAKTFADQERAKEQRRLAGIASGRARALKALSKCRPKIKRKLLEADLAAYASQIRRLNESASALS